MGVRKFVRFCVAGHCIDPSMAVAAVVFPFSEPQSADSITLQTLRDLKSISDVKSNQMTDLATENCGSFTYTLDLQSSDYADGRKFIIGSSSWGGGNVQFMYGSNCEGHRRVNKACDKASECRGCNGTTCLHRDVCDFEGFICSRRATLGDPVRREYLLSRLFDSFGGFRRAYCLSDTYERGFASGSIATSETGSWSGFGEKVSHSVLKQTSCQSGGVNFRVLGWEVVGKVANEMAKEYEHKLVRGVGNIQVHTLEDARKLLKESFLLGKRLLDIVKAVHSKGLVFTTMDLNDFSCPKGLISSDCSMADVVLINYSNVAFPYEYQYELGVDTIVQKRKDDGSLVQIGHHASYHLTPFELDDAIKALDEGHFPPIRTQQQRDNLYHIIEVMRQWLSQQRHDSCKTAQEALDTALKSNPDNYRKQLFTRLRFAKRAAFFDLMECPSAYAHLGDDVKEIIGTKQYIDSLSDEIKDGPDSGPLELFLRTVLRVSSTGQIDREVYDRLKGFLATAMSDL